MTTTPDTPTYYVVHALPDGSTRALYPVQLLTEAAGLQYPHEARSWRVPGRDDLAGRDPDRVAAMCNLCHLNYDRHLHARNAARTRARRRAERDLNMDPLEGM